jgi:hypothetical protein
VVTAQRAAGRSGREGDAFPRLREMILDPSVRPDAIADLLDALPLADRVDAIRRLGRSAQRTLYAKVEGFAPLRLVDLVPADQPELVEVRHLGRNTLPAFRIFEKRFCRMPGSEASAPDVLAGYNHQTMAQLTGPGYFLAEEDLERDEILIDYGRLPGVRPAAWPEIRSNERGLGRFVYGFMVDRLRRVSAHVTIGSAARNGRDLGSYFVLSRAD